MIALLTGVSGAWADNLTLVTAQDTWSGVTFYTTTGSATSGWGHTCLSNASASQPQVFINSNNAAESSGGFNCANGRHAKGKTFYLNIQPGYKITGYSITFKSINTSTTITAADGETSQTADGSTPQTLSVTGLSCLKTSYSVSGDGNAIITAYTITYEAVDGGKYRLIQHWNNTTLFYCYAKSSELTKMYETYTPQANKFGSDYVWIAETNNCKLLLKNLLTSRYVRQFSGSYSDYALLNATTSGDAENMKIAINHTYGNFYTLQSTSSASASYIDSFGGGDNSVVNIHNALHQGDIFRFVPVKTVNFVDGGAAAKEVPVTSGGGTTNFSTIYVATDGSDELTLSNQYKYRINGGDPQSYSAASTAITAAGTSDITVTVVEPSSEQTTAYNKVLGWKSSIFLAEGLVTDASNYSGNAIMASADGTGLPALLDNNTSTFCHTAYSGNGAGVADPGADHYIQAYIEDGTDAFYLYTYKRNGNNRPTKIDITASNNGSDWTDITSLTSGLTTNDDFLSDKITLGATYKYIRFTVPTTNTGNKFGDHVFFTYSEFWLLPSNDHTDDAFDLAKTLKPAIELTSDDIDDINDIDLAVRSATIAPWKAAFITSAGTSSNFGKVGWPSASAYSTFCDAINDLTVDDDYEADAATAMATLWGTITYPATGYYYLHNFGTGRYAFSDETVSTSQDYLNGESRTAKYVWKVTLDGTNVKVYSLTGHGITLNNNGGQQTGNIALETPDANSFTTARGAFYLGSIQDPNQTSFTKDGSSAYASATNPMKLTHWNGGSGANKGDRQGGKAYWQFEPVDASDYDVYTVSIVNNQGDNYVSYSGSETTGNLKVYDGGCYFMTKDASVSASDFTGESVANCTSVISIEGKAITVTYTNWKTTIDDYIATNDVWTKLANAGKPGYPENTPGNTGSLLALQTAISGGTYNQTIYDNLVIAYDAYKALSVITTVPTGKFYRFKAAKSGKYLKGEQSSTYDSYATAYYCLNSAEQEGAKSIFYFDSEKHLLGYSSGRYTRYTSHLAPVGSSEKSTYEFETPKTYFGSISVKANATSGGWGRYLYSYDNANTYANQQSSKADQTDWYIEEVTSLPVNITSAGYATLNAPVALTIPANVQAYYISSLSSTEATLTEITGTIPANTPVILKADVADTYNFTITTSSAFDGTNKLSGTIAAKAFDADQIYTLQRNVANTQTGLFPKAAGTLAGFKAYLLASELPAPALTKGLLFMFEGADGINTVQGSGFKAQDSEIYNLAGQKMSKLQRGVNIINGKKVFVK